MEVHTHTHTARKKWTHYLWEFLMLFLAVFCGFLAENQREHMVEHQREKQYMASLIEDLRADTAALGKKILATDSIVRYADSTVLFLASYRPSHEISVRLAKIIGTGGARITLIHTDRTSSQLKNSGAMRLIRKKDITDKILEYWKQIDQTDISLDRYNIYRNAGREILFKLWVIPNVYDIVLYPQKDSIRQLRVIDQDTKKWDELTNLIAISRSICFNNILPDFKEQYRLAAALINLIKKEYHLK